MSSKKKMVALIVAAGMSHTDGKGRTVVYLADECRVLDYDGA